MLSKTFKEAKRSLHARRKVIFHSVMSYFHREGTQDLRPLFIRRQVRFGTWMKAMNHGTSISSQTIDKECNRPEDAECFIIPLDETTRDADALLTASIDDPLAIECSPFIITNATMDDCQCWMYARPRPHWDDWTWLSELFAWNSALTHSVCEWKCKKISVMRSDYVHQLTGISCVFEGW